MWRKAYPWLTGVLAVALISATWRLRAAEAELDRVERLVAAGAAARSVGPSPATDRPVPAGLGHSPNVAGEGADMATEWEQAVPPMDS